MNLVIGSSTFYRSKVLLFDSLTFFPALSDWQFSECWSRSSQYPISRHYFSKANHETSCNWHPRKQFKVPLIQQYPTLHLVGICTIPLAQDIRQNRPMLVFYENIHRRKVECTISEQQMQWNQLRRICLSLSVEITINIKASKLCPYRHLITICS